MQYILTFNKLLTPVLVCQRSSYSIINSCKMTCLILFAFSSTKKILIFNLRRSHRTSNDLPRRFKQTFIILTFIFYLTTNREEIKYKIVSIDQ